MHRYKLSQLVRLKRNCTGNASLNTLNKMGLGIPIENQLHNINECLKDIDQVFIPSTINNFINRTFVIRKEGEIISIFEEAEPRVLNYLICNSRLGLIFYKIKDHRSFKHQHRTQLIELLALEKISQLTVHSRVIVLHALQIMKLPANMRAEHCVRNIILSTKQDDLSELKTLMDAKGDYFCMNKLIYDDIKSEIVRNDILKHIQNQAKVQYSHMAFNTRRAKDRKRKFWRKVLSDVDDTLTCSGGSYPSGIDKRYGKKVVYPGVLGFYRELDLGVDGPEEWPSHTVGNLVFLSARPHIYRDVSEKINFAKFEKLQTRGMHTSPSLLAGDITTGLETLMTGNFAPLAQKKFDNFKKYVSIYPEFRHVFICDNGQGDVQAAELMVEAFPKNVEAIYVQEVQDIGLTYKYDPSTWKDRLVKPFFFKTYTDAALHAATRNPPLMRISGLRRICVDAINDFYMIQSKQWPSQSHKWNRHMEINQSLSHCNQYLISNLEDSVPLLEAEYLWKEGQKVSTPYGKAVIKSFDPVHDLYEVELDWRPLHVQVAEYTKNERREIEKHNETENDGSSGGTPPSIMKQTLETVFETDEELSQIITPAQSNLSKQTSMEFDENNDIGGETTLDDEEGDCSELDNPVVTLPLQCVDETFAVVGTNNDLPPALIDEVVEDAEIDEKNDSSSKGHCIIARIHCRFITKYTPPVLPSLSANETKTGFSFYGSRTSTEAKQRAFFNKNDKCITPYGYGIVTEYREQNGIIVLSMSGWSATCYLKVEDVKTVSEGFFGRMLRKISTETKSSSSPQNPAQKKDPQSPYTINTAVCTPYGIGYVVRPLERKDALFESVDTLQIPADTLDLSYEAKHDTIGINLSSWKLADGSNPTLYCTPETAQNWRTIEDTDDDWSKASGGFLSALSIVSESVKKLIVGKQEKKSAEVPSEIIVPNFERYYEDGAAVMTPFGNGTVGSFRTQDGIYFITLDSWIMADNSCAKAYLKKDSLSHQIAPGCIEGYPVLTSFGVSGILVSVQPRTGVHIVTISLAGLVCYLQPKDVLRPLKAAVNDEVLTQYGNGDLVKYRVKDDVYEIDLVWGSRLYAKAEAFDRDFGREEKEGFGIDWVFRLFFSTENSVKGGGVSGGTVAAGGSRRSRSRSNSIQRSRSRSDSLASARSLRSVTGGAAAK